MLSLSGRDDGPLAMMRLSAFQLDWPAEYRLSRSLRRAYVGHRRHRTADIFPQKPKRRRRSTPSSLASSQPTLQALCNADV